MTVFDSFGFARFREAVPLASISITGGHVDRVVDPAALARFRALLEETFPGARLIIRTQFRPEGYGHARTVNVTPVTPPNGREDERRLGITRMDIGDLWRAMVGWPEGL